MVRSSQWCVIVPVSPAAVAKSRLRPLGAARQQLARTFALDVIAAARHSVAVTHLLVVGDGTLVGEADLEQDALLLVDTSVASLNESISAAESRARALGYSSIAVLVADIPCVRPADLDDLLTRAKAVPRGFVADHTGTGTTVLTTTGPALAPAFGADSAARHQGSGATRIEVSVRVSYDIDDPADIAMALVYGLGAATSSALGAIAAAQPAVAE